MINDTSNIGLYTYKVNNKSFSMDITSLYQMNDCNSGLQRWTNQQFVKGMENILRPL